MLQIHQFTLQLIGADIDQADLLGDTLSEDTEGTGHAHHADAHNGDLVARAGQHFGNLV